MLYLRVKPEFDNHRKNDKCDIFIANELYTLKEFEKVIQEYPHNKKQLNKIFEYVDISRKQTYFFFGARFEKGKEWYKK